MIKKGNTRIDFTTSQEIEQVLNYLSRVLNMSKTKIINKCLTSGCSLKVLWRKIDAQTMQKNCDTVDIVYYVKWARENIDYDSQIDLSTINKLYREKYEEENKRLGL